MAIDSVKGTDIELRLLCYQWFRVQDQHLPFSGNRYTAVEKKSTSTRYAKTDYTVPSKHSLPATATWKCQLLQSPRCIRSYDNLRIKLLGEICDVMFACIHPRLHLVNWTRAG